VNPGDLVFDVGAKDGIYTDIFLSMNARGVVAVEPEISLAKRLMRHGVYSVNVALGSHNHYDKLYSGAIKGVSTLSEKHMQLERFSSFKWKEPIPINVTTLDALAQVYGIPDFIKIDVEGYEVEVIKGMSFAPKALSFEFIPEDIRSILHCTIKIDSLGKYQYTYTIGLEPDMQFVIPWGSAIDMILHIRNNVPINEAGDVWVRRVN
jgi:FkbM family methyltransferase